MVRLTIHAEPRRARKSGDRGGAGIKGVGVNLGGARLGKTGRGGVGIKGDGVNLGGAGLSTANQCQTVSRRTA